MGIHQSNHLIVYDNNEKYGLFSAPRVWWMFRVRRIQNTLKLNGYILLLYFQVFGHRAVSVLDGGLPHWKFCEFPLECGPPKVFPPQSYTATYNPELVATMQSISECLTTGSAQVILI